MVEICKNDYVYIISVSSPLFKGIFKVFGIMFRWFRLPEALGMPKKNIRREQHNRSGSAEAGHLDFSCNSSVNFV